MTAERAGLTEAALGRRWVIRYRLPDGSATDVIGWIDGLTADEVCLSEVTGRVRRIARSGIVAARAAPPAAGGPDPVRTPADELERHTLRGWVAASEPLGEWTLRSAGGFTGRANSCHAVGDPGRPVAAAADRIVAYAAEQQILPRAAVVHGSVPDRALRELGWTETYEPTDVLVARLTALLGPAAIPAAVEVAERLERAWWDAYQQSRPNHADPAVVRTILDGSPPRAFASVGRGGRTVAIARGHLSADWLGLAAIWVHPEHRLRGVATEMTRALGHWAARRGARNVYLQVASANAGALAAYARLGFVRHHSYGYLRPPS
jgi:RimJ/RimL family protein N-acetyltransferase